jgi:hypothetical protein
MRKALLPEEYRKTESSQRSKYFEILKADLIRIYGDAKGARLANRFWEIRENKDYKHEEERIKIFMGLA